MRQTTTRNTLRRLMSAGVGSAASLAIAGCDAVQRVTLGEAPPAYSEAATAGDESTAPVDGEGEPGDGLVWPDPDPFASTYAPYPSGVVALIGAKVYDGAGGVVENAAIVLSGGRIAAVGPVGDVEVPEGAARIDAAGKVVTPGIIDIHSHLGNYPSPGTDSTSDGNEATGANTAGVWTEHSVWPQDAGFTRAIAGGVTTLQVLPGSANLFGGRSVILKNVPVRTVQGMKFPGAAYGLKMACGENPKRVYGERGGPATRMGNFEGYRKGWIEAAAYRDKWTAYREKHEKWKKEGGHNKDGEKSDKPEPPTRDLKLETLAAALDGEITVNMHCYRADEMAQVLDLADEFGYRVRTFHHAVEAYKIADLLAERGVCAAVWADWWGFKLEAYDAVRENAALVHTQPGGCAIIHSDDSNGIQRLNQEAGKALADGRLMGLDIAPEAAMAWITLNPAKAMGIDDVTGSLEVGKMADVVVWSGEPFSVYARAEKVYIDGALMFDRFDPDHQARMDFELGQSVEREAGGAGK